MTTPPCVRSTFLKLPSPPASLLALLPLAIGLGGTSRIWSPFASSFAWGLAFATVVTLFLVPALYCIVHDLSRLFGRGDTYADAPVFDSIGDDSPGESSPADG